MPQGLTAAVANQAPPWPAGNLAARREMGTQEMAIPCCRPWVRRFFAVRSGRRREDSGRAETEGVPRHPARPRQVGNGQVPQALDALAFYDEPFRALAWARCQKGAHGWQPQRWLVRGRAVRHRRPRRWP
jgi:hypothetical protein